MKNKILSVVALSALALASCKKDNLSSKTGFGAHNTKASYAAAAAMPHKTVTGVQSGNLYFDRDTVYVLQGLVVLTATHNITIESGTFITGLPDADNKPGTLVITRGAQIFANGTSSAPIVFTSPKLVGSATGTPHAGDWGGVIVLGKAHVNAGQKTIEGLALTQPFDNYYGPVSGVTTDNDNSGTITYVRIEFPGYILSADNEINGLTLGGVGSGTTLNHIQVSYSADDSFEFFGGSVSPSYLVSVAADDDNFDFDNGYNGTLQYALAVADFNSTHSRQTNGNSDSNGIESDNNAPAEDGTFTLTPKTHPVLRNLTIVGTESTNSGYLYAARIRRGSEVEIHSSIIMGYPNGINFDGTSSFFTSGVSKVEDSFVHGFTSFVLPSTLTLSSTNATSTDANSNFDAALSQPFYNNGYSSLDFSVTGSSIVPAGAGAFATSTWTTGWTLFGGF
ncbi:hypothetical protein [Mucilaginibacter paludis]|uniref:Lipoprotein n=1 Tax=Mucilaginibacter paludis DSM 18603 TaxID=714943 RepID=H1Y927_9SPHI|nr:hypothetical protein [Mucilaginibacter paludis]EHQ29065.1 hypothetical protein Mucpa_4986 [Mucilaginibacter paludis DSM 18603]